jgi:hypothetical protein
MVLRVSGVTELTPSAFMAGAEAEAVTLEAVAVVEDLQAVAVAEDLHSQLPVRPASPTNKMSVPETDRSSFPGSR